MVKNSGISKEKPKNPKNADHPQRGFNTGF